MSIHVAHVTTVHPLSDNRVLRKECRAGVRSGFRVTLIGPGSAMDGPVVHEPGVSVVRTKFFPGRIRRALAGSFKIYRELLRLSPDIVHGHDPELLPALLLYRTFHPRKVVSYDAHEKLAGQIAGKPYIPRYLVPLVSFLSVRAVAVFTKALDGVVCATLPIEKTIKNKRTCTVQNFPWFEDLQTESSRRIKDDFVACYVGAISEERGLSIMIAAVRASKRCSKLLLVGPATGDVRRTIDNNVDIVDYRGRVDSSEVPMLLGEASVGLAVLNGIPNYVDSQPTKVFEYMAAKLPFIASDFQYWKDLFGVYGCGLFVNPEDPASLAVALDTLAGDAGRSVNMGANGRAAFERHFTFEGQAEILTSFHRDLVARKVQSGA